MAEAPRHARVHVDEMRSAVVMAMMMMSTKSSVATAFHPMAIHGGRSSLPLRALPLPLPSLPGSGPRLRPGGAGRPRGWLTARPCAPVSCYHSSTADSTDQLQRRLRLGRRPLRARPWPPAFLRKLSRRHEPCSTRPARVRGKAADSECPVLTACKFESLDTVRKDTVPEGLRRDRTDLAD